MKINVNNTARKRLLLALLGGLIISLMLCSCSGCDSCVQGCAQLQSCYYPELAAGEGDAVPVIAHSPSAEEVNAQLEEYFSPVNALVDKANEGRDIFSLEHKLTARDGCYYLSSAILCQPGGRLELPEIYIPYFGQAVMPEHESLWLPDDPQAMENKFLFMHEYPNGQKEVFSNAPVRFASTPFAEFRPAGPIGCDTREILREVGYTDEKIDAMLEAKTAVIAGERWS